MQHGFVREREREREPKSLWPLAYLIGAAAKDQFFWLIELLDHSLFLGGCLVHLMSSFIMAFIPFLLA